jgi:hypothetical protein
MNDKEVKIDDAIDDLRDENEGKKFLFGFILGTINISLMIFFTALLNKIDNLFYKQFFIILLPLVMFVILIILIRGAFKIHNESIGYGLIFATFFVPIFLFLTFILFFVIL